MDQPTGCAGALCTYIRTSSAAPGAVYAVAGSSGKISGGPLDHPVMTVSLSRLGSLVLDVDGPRLDVTFLDDTGIAVDTFRLEHDVSLFADDFESGDLGAWSSSVGAEPLALTPR